MRKYLVLSFLLPAMFSCSMAQNPTQNKYAELLTVESAREHLTTLTSKEYDGRGTGQEGGQKAAEYIAKTFKDLGLKPDVNGTYLQPVALEKSSYAVDNYKNNNIELVNSKDSFVQGTNNLTNYDANEIVVVEYGIQSEKYND